MSLIYKIYQWFLSVLVKFDRYVIIPSSQWLIRQLSKRTRDRIRAYQMLPEGMPDWKDKALENFSLWMEALPNGPPTAEATAPAACDLYTLLAEFSALRQEIKIQNRQQNKSIKTFNSFMDSYEGTISVFKETADEYRTRSHDMATLENNIRQTAVKATVQHFLDVRDALRRGLEAARSAGTGNPLFRRKKDRMTGVIEGYEMAIRRFDRALAAAHVYPVEVLHKPFDPATMKAVETREVPDKAQGIVIEEHLGGFMMNNDILRTAEVVVSQ